MERQRLANYSIKKIKTPFLKKSVIKRRIESEPGGSEKEREAGGRAGAAARACHHSGPAAAGIPRLCGAGAGPSRLGAPARVRSPRMGLSSFSSSLVFRWSAPR